MPQAAHAAEVDRKLGEIRARDQVKLTQVHEAANAVRKLCASIFTEVQELKAVKAKSVDWQSRHAHTISNAQGANVTYSAQQKR